MLQWLICAAWALTCLLSVINYCLAGWWWWSKLRNSYISFQKMQVKAISEISQEECSVNRNCWGNDCKKKKKRKRYNTFSKLWKKWEFWACKIFSLKFLPSPLHRIRSHSLSQNNHKSVAVSWGIHFEFSLFLKGILALSILRSVVAPEGFSFGSPVDEWKGPTFLERV